MSSPPCDLLGEVSLQVAFTPRPNRKSFSIIFSLKLNYISSSFPVPRFPVEFKKKKILECNLSGICSHSLTLSLSFMHTFSPCWLLFATQFGHDITSRILNLFIVCLRSVHIHSWSTLTKNVAKSANLANAMSVDKANNFKHEQASQGQVYISCSLFQFQWRWACLH